MCYQNDFQLVSLEKRSESGYLSWRNAPRINIQSQAFFALLKWHFSAGYLHNNRWAEVDPILNCL